MESSLVRYRFKAIPKIHQLAKNNDWLLWEFWHTINTNIEQGDKQMVQGRNSDQFSDLHPCMMSFFGSTIKIIAPFF